MSSAHTPQSYESAEILRLKSIPGASTFFPSHPLKNCEVLLHIASKPEQ